MGALFLIHPFISDWCNIEQRCSHDLHVDGVLHQGDVGHSDHAASNGWKQLPEANDGDHRHGQKRSVKFLGSFSFGWLEWPGPVRRTSRELSESQKFNPPNPPKKMGTLSLPQTTPGLNIISLDPKDGRNRLGCLIYHSLAQPVWIIIHNPVRMQKCEDVKSCQTMSNHVKPAFDHSKPLTQSKHSRRWFCSLLTATNIPPVWRYFSFHPDRWVYLGPTSRNHKKKID